MAVVVPSVPRPEVLPREESPREVPTIEALIAALDPDVRAAIDDVDRTLITLTLAQTPWNRLRSASRMAQCLGKLRDSLASQRG
jgi:hypothetical protein